jgi:hypothetical protein
LVLFRVEGRKTERGRIVAHLVGPGGAAHSMGDMDHSDHSSHVHNHQPEIQVYSGRTNGIELLNLDPGRRVDISIQGSSHFVDVHPSYDDHCPKLSQVLQHADDPEFRNQSRGRSDDNFIRTTVTVDRGTIRVKDVVTWDNSGFPLTDDPQAGFRAATPARVRFFGSALQGHMGSECVIDVEDSGEVLINDSGKTDQPTRHQGTSAGSPRVPPDTVEIMVTNFPPQQRTALPWSLHFLMLFRAAGYTPRTLPEDLVARFGQFARRHVTMALRNHPNEVDAVLAAEMALLPNRVGFPFPYIDVDGSLTQLARLQATPLSDPWNLPLCPFSDDGDG